MLYRNNGKTYIKTDLEAVITSYNQGNMILEAVQSICNQTLPVSYTHLDVYKRQPYILLLCLL